MDKVERYLQIFNNYLLVKNKDEIVEDIRDSIIDSLDNDYSENNVARVLQELGNPRQLAIDYSSGDKYLIGPKYYDKFIYALISTLKLTYLIYFIIAVILIIIQIFMSDFNPFDLFGYIYLVIPITIIAFMCVLIVFIIAERVNKSGEYFKTFNTDWDVNELDTNVNNENDFKLTYFIFSSLTIIITTIIMLYIILKDFTFTSDGITYTLDIINNNYNILIIVTSIVYLVLELMYKYYLFRNRVYTKTSIVFMVAIRIYFLIISYILLIRHSVINNNIIDEVKFDFNSIIFYIIVITIFIEIVSAVYKYIKNKNI